MPVRPLSSVLQQIAERELNEEPNRVQADINHIKEWISKQSHLNCRTDDQWLLCFLRYSKFSLERAKEKLEFFCTVRTLLPEIFDNRDPYLPEIQLVLNKGFGFPLLKASDKDCFRVATVRCGEVNPDETDLITAMKVITMYLDILMLEDDNFAVSGHLACLFLQNFSLKYASQLTPSTIKKMAYAYQSYPSRFVGLHLINPPQFIENIMVLIKLFIKEKAYKRISCYKTEKNLYDISKTVAKEVLPVEFGGEDGDIGKATKYWKAKVESYREWFLEDSQYRNDEAKRIGNPKTSSEMFGVEGSFRKLEID